MPLSLFKERDDSHQFKPVLVEIEENPGSPLGRTTFWLVVAVFGFFLLWTIFGQVDVVITSRGKVIPDGQVKLVQPLNGGVITEILVKEGDFVKKGQPLVMIDPATTAPTLASSQKTLAHIQLEQARLNASANGRGFGAGGTQAEIYQASVGALDKQLQAKEKLLENLSAQASAKRVEAANTQELLNTNREREQRLAQVKDIIPKDEYQKVQNEIVTQESKLKTLSYELEQLKFQQQQTREEMGYIHQNYRTTTLSDLSEKEKQVNQLVATIEEASFRNARQTLVAPVDGYVHELFVHTVGGVVTPAQKIVSIVPVNTPLMVQATVLNKDIGYVKTGLPVALKLDTFEFQKYGTLRAQVAQIDRDSRENEKLGPTYTVYMTPLDRSLLVDGKRQFLTSGLSLTSEIKVGKRRIIEFFIYPLIKHLDEGMSVR